MPTMGYMSGANTPADNSMAELDFEGEAFMSDLERALKADEGIENLNKAETIYYLSAKLTGDVPEGHPSDHNGNVTNQRIREWATVVADYARRNGTDAFKPEEVLSEGDEEETEGTDEEETEE